MIIDKQQQNVKSICVLAGPSAVPRATYGFHYNTSTAELSDGMSPIITKWPDNVQVYTTVRRIDHEVHRKEHNIIIIIFTLTIS